MINLLKKAEADEKKKNLGDQYQEGGECEALILITALVTSFVR